MVISGFTIARNAVRLQYPILASIQSILPICDEFIINVGDSDDETLELVKSIPSQKIKIIRTTWDMTQGAKVLSEQTNIALSHCRGDWAFYLQTDEVVHEKDLQKIKNCMKRHLNRHYVDVIRFKWLHFYGSHWRYRIDRGWYQKQDRIIRNNGTIQSYGDAFAFERKDGKPLCREQSNSFIYHYGWVNNPSMIMMRKENARNIGYAAAFDDSEKHNFGDLNRFPIYFGTHPAGMKEIVEANSISRDDWQSIERAQWWNPFKIFRVRYKTSRRVKIEMCK